MIINNRILLVKFEWVDIFRAARKYEQAYKSNKLSFYFAILAFYGRGLK